MFQTHLTISFIRAKFGDIRFSDSAYDAIVHTGKIQRVNTEYLHDGINLINIIGTDRDALLIIREVNGEEYVDLFSNHRF